MNAHALLTSQGWRGTGHSLHATDDNTGLSRPLLVSQKQNNLGVGKKQHKTSDMWWLNAFDKSLKGLDTSKQGTVVQTVTSGGLDMVAKGGAKYVGSGGGLYASFVRGESLTGTIMLEATSERPLKKKGRKAEERKETKEVRRARKAAKRAARANEVAVEIPESEQVEEITEKAEMKDERREQKKRLKQVERSKAKADLERAKKKKRRKEKI
ncbi:DNA-directed RNA polymerase [Chlorociboria aeruginascens]|nr:DNA-directed RNA polymerase [Chlorociboria aeruginascens]